MIGKCDCGVDYTEQEIEKFRNKGSLTEERMKLFNEVKEQIEKDVKIEAIQAEVDQSNKPNEIAPKGGG